MIRLQPVFARFTIVLTVLVLGSCSGKPRQQVVVPVPGPAFDSKFLRDRIHHSRETIRLTEDCSAKASRSELRALCEQSRSDAAQELDALAKLQAANAAPGSTSNEADEHESELFRGFQKEMEKTTGPAFDAALLRALRQHYRQGSDEAASCRTVTINSDLKQLCHALFPKEESFLRQINAYLCDWTKHCSDR